MYTPPADPDPVLSLKKLNFFMEKIRLKGYCPGIELGGAKRNVTTYPAICHGFDDSA